jgi:hypothetical protein
VEIYKSEFCYPSNKRIHKIHKVDTTIRHVVNWKNAPAYKLARMFSEKIKTYTFLPYVFNVKNTTQLIKDLTDIPFDPKLKLAFFDITDMYSNIRTYRGVSEYYQHNMRKT